MEKEIEWKEYERQLKMAWERGCSIGFIKGSIGGIMVAMLTALIAIILR